MPALSMFNRQWNIGSDDFVFPGIGILFIRLCWLVTIIGVFSSHRTAFYICEKAQVLESFYLGMMVLLALKIIVDILLVFYSSRGTIKECGARRLVPKILYVNFGLIICEVVWLVIGSYWSADDYMGCDWVVVNTVRVLVVLAWLGIFITIIAIVILFSSFGKISSASDGSALWSRRCQLLCCNFCKTDQNTTESFKEIADLVHEFFEDVDLVPTDVAAGLLLVSREQRRNFAQRDNGTQSQRVLLDRNQAVDMAISDDFDGQIQTWMTIHNAARYMNFALASYGWPLYSFSNMPFGCCSLCLSSPNSQPTLGKVQGDCCSCNLITIERETSYIKSEIYYASFSNKLFEIPFIIFRDHEDNSVVIALRGTLSLKDAMIDMTAFGEELGGGYPKSFKVHKGMLKSAQLLLEKLSQDQLLKGAFVGYESYNLVVCGHSLGAGVASILSLLMKPEYPQLRCFSFSPPGGLLSEEAYRLSQMFTLSVVLGDDVIPRLSVQTMQDLKVNVMQAINECKYAKYKIFWSLPFHALNCTRCRMDEDGEQTLIERPLIVGRSKSYTVEINSDQDASVQKAVESRDLLRIQPPFYPPGCIMYITSNIDIADRGCCTHDTDYSWRWTKQSEFLSLRVSPKMMSDHMPNILRDALNRLVPDHPQSVVAHTVHT